MTFLAQDANLLAADENLRAALGIFLVFAVVVFVLVALVFFANYFRLWIQSFLNGF